MFQHIQLILEEVDLAPGEFSILLLIQGRPDQTQSGLARIARIERSTIGPTISHLESFGYVKRRPDKSDGRAFSVRVTPAGNRAIKKISPVLEQFESELDQLLSHKGRGELLKNLGAIESFGRTRSVS